MPWNVKETKTGFNGLDGSRKDKIMDTMDIYSNPGDEIVYAFPDNGRDSEQEDAIDAGLEEGQTYIISDIEVDDWKTRVWLEDVANPEWGFNSVMFANAEDYFA